MKKFSKILVCLLVCVFCFGLFGCGKKGIMHPSADAEVYGNGGLAVQKGEYLYFVNGFKEATSMKKQDAKYTVGALMVAKLDEYGNLVVDENGVVKDEYCKFMSQKLCGFEATGLYIFGNYLYFASPCQEKESGKNGSWAKELVVFYRIKLDKTGKVEKIYQSDSKNTELEYNYYSDGKSVFLLCYERGSNNKLVRVNASSKKENVVAKNVSSLVLTKDSVTDAYKYVFYVVKDEENANPYLLKQLDVISGKSSTYSQHKEEITVRFVADGFVFISHSLEFASSNVVLKYSNVLDSTKVFKNCFESEYIDKYTNLYLTPNEDSFIGVKSNGDVYCLWWGENRVKKLFSDSSVNVIDFCNGCIIYVTNDYKIKSYSYSDQPEEPTTVATLTEDLKTSYFDLDRNFVYFFKTNGENAYLYRLQVRNIQATNTEQLVGKLYEKESSTDDTKTDGETDNGTESSN